MAESATKESREEAKVKAKKKAIQESNGKRHDEPTKTNEKGPLEWDTENDRKGQEKTKKKRKEEKKKRKMEKKKRKTARVSGRYNVDYFGLNRGDAL